MPTEKTVLFLFARYETYLVTIQYKRHEETITVTIDTASATWRPISAVSNRGSWEEGNYGRMPAWVNAAREGALLAMARASLNAIDNSGKAFGNWVAVPPPEPAPSL